jgi:hypothetical protein
MKLRIFLTLWWPLCVIVNGVVYYHNGHATALILAVFSMAMFVRSAFKLIKQ